MKKLEWVPPVEWPKGTNPTRFNVWRSSDYLIQAFREKDGVVRLAVAGRGPNALADGNDIPWGDLQAIKSACGYGSFDAVEAFPPEDDLHPGAGNARYLWILPKNQRLTFIWRRPGHQLSLLRDQLTKAKEA